MYMVIVLSDDYQLLLPVGSFIGVQWKKVFVAAKTH